MNTRRGLTLMLWIFGLNALALSADPVALKFEMLGSIEGTKQWDWWQARTAYIPGTSPLWITTMSETGKSGSHDFHDIYQSFSRDKGITWSKPAAIASLQRTLQPDGFEIAPGDLWPTWHAHSGKVLVTGKTFNFEAGKGRSVSAKKCPTQSWTPKKAHGDGFDFWKLHRKIMPATRSSVRTRAALNESICRMATSFCRFATGVTLRSTTTRVSSCVAASMERL